MAQDPTKFSYCPTKDTKKKSFIKNFEKLTELDIESDTLDNVSALIKTFKVTASTNTIDKALPRVSETLNVPLNGVSSQLAKLNPGAANDLISQMRVLSGQLIAGSLTIQDAPQIASQISNILKTFKKVQISDQKVTEVCYPTPPSYASDLAEYAPKFKFLFVVEFVMNEAFAQLPHKVPAFLVKQFQRPNINYEYDDVNIYNFRTKVLKKTSFEPLNIQIHDDIKNETMMFLLGYLRASIPLVNVTASSVGILEEASMLYGSQSLSSSISTLKGEHKTIINHINVYHVYDWGKRMNIYQFFNPRIMNFNLDDWDMADSSNGNSLSVQFSYDALNFITDKLLNDPAYNIEQKTGIGRYPLRGNFLGTKATQQTLDEKQLTDFIDTTESNVDLTSISNILGL